MTDAPRRIEELSRQESLALLGSVTLGRIVFTRNALPEIRPVNHLVDDEAIIIRSHLGGAIASYAGSSGGAVIAYEADNLDPVEHLGWSVIVTGTAHIIREPAAIARYQHLLRPWVAREMDYVISVHAKIVTGIRLTSLAAPETGRAGVVPLRGRMTGSDAPSHGGGDQPSAVVPR